MQAQEKLLRAAGEVFAEYGYQAATIREICSRAEVNVAAVNYHFGDKMALYVAVLRESVCAESAEQVVEQSGPPEEVIRAVIQHAMRRMFGRERPAWHVRIMAHELTQPSPALSRVIDEVLAPRYARLRGAVGAIIGRPPGHDLTRLGAHSIIAQVIHYFHARPVIARVWPDLKMTPKRVDQIAAHIAEFSLAALRAMAEQKTEKARK